MATAPVFRRVLLKLSGEALNGAGQAGIGEEQLFNIARSIIAAAEQGVEIGIVVGGGNFLRGATVKNKLLKRATADHMGMLATILNGLALRDAISTLGYPVALFSALAVSGIAESFDLLRVQQHLASGSVVIFAGGTGNPFVTTDSAASLRAVEIEAQVLLKATKVDGVYDLDPAQHPQAKKYEQLRFNEVLERRLAVMDIAAFSQCQDFNIPIRVFNLFKPGALTAALLGTAEGTIIF